jgi:hypothetical protein
VFLELLHRLLMHSSGAPRGTKSGILLMCLLIIYVMQLSAVGIYFLDRLCGLVVRVLGYRFRGPGFDSRRYQIF